ncbi:MAG: FMN-binding protein [Acidobacteria bacterium]|nr:FMN-binding protein [Acidobacteriota bacterium]
MQRLALPCALLLSSLFAVSPAEGRVYLTQQEALAQAFPAPARAERRVLYLDVDQARRAGDLAGVAVEHRVIPYYVGTVDGCVAGYAYFDTHPVRTLAETIMVLLAPDGRIVRIDLLSFDEPEDYLLSGRWLQQFTGRSLDDDLLLNRGIRAMTGATLSARAVTQAARRILAVHQLLVAPPPAGSARRPEREEP